jgi:ParB family transcriptional regulator, chromosome partitioning protein
VLDPDTLDAVWRAAAARLAQPLADAGIAVGVARERGYQAPEGLAHLPFVHWPSQSDEVRAALDAVRTRLEQATAAVEAADSAEAADTALGALLQARLDLARLAAGTGEVLAVLLTPVRGGLDATFYQRPAPVEPEAELEADEHDDGDDEDGGTEPTAWRPDVAVPDVTVELAGVSHAQHAARTEMASQGLIRDLADHPAAALILLVAQLFKAVIFPVSTSPSTSALQVRAESWRRPAAEDGLGAVVWARLEGRRAAYLASGARPIGWIAALSDEDRGALLAELVAVCLDLREPKTTHVRRAARAEAVEIAALCGADLAQHWTPDAAFAGVHSKPQLLAFLAEMGGGPDKAAALKKDELVQATVEAAAAARWVPACLQWRAPVAAEAAESDEAPAAGTAAGRSEDLAAAADGEAQEAQAA